MSVNIELSNGKIKQYATYWTELPCEDYYPEKPYHTKCGLSFKKEPRGEACGHLECAIDAAKNDAYKVPAVFVSLNLMLIIAGWYEFGDFLAAVYESRILLIVSLILYILMSLSPLVHWLELREYKNHGTIRGQKARIIW
jgi:hypothetical protein